VDRSLSRIRHRTSWRSLSRWFTKSAALGLAICSIRNCGCSATVPPTNPTATGYCASPVTSPPLLRLSPWTCPPRSFLRSLSRHSRCPVHGTRSPPSKRFGRARRGCPLGGCKPRSTARKRSPRQTGIHDRVHHRARHNSPLPSGEGHRHDLLPGRLQARGKDAALTVRAHRATSGKSVCSQGQNYLSAAECYHRISLGGARD
jgi:hypothetical protein